MKNILKTIKKISIRYFGGVKHQFKETEDGFKVRLVAEFPTICPTGMVKEHQMHLACEFSYWFNWIINKKSKKIN